MEAYFQEWASLLLLGALIFAMRPSPKLDLADDGAFPVTADIMPVLQARCVTCHTARPDHPGFAVSPLGIQLEHVDAVEAQALIIFNSVNLKQSMPLANATGMSDEERELIARWYAGQIHNTN